MGRAFVEEVFQGRETMGVRDVGIEGSNINSSHDYMGRDEEIEVGGEGLFAAKEGHVSAYIDAHLQPIIKSLPSYIKDTQHLLEIIRSLPMPLPLNTIMATVDVTSLYINNSHPII